MASKNNAHARKVTKKKEPFSFSKLPKEKQKLIKYIAAGAAALIIVLIVLGSLDLLPHFNGSLHVISGKVRGVKDGDLILNVSDRDSDPSYYKIGRVEIPAGYENDESYNIKTDDNETEFAFRPVGDDAPEYIRYVAVLGCNSTIDERMEMLYGLTAVEDEEGNVTYSDRIDAVSAKNGNPYCGYIYGGDTADEYNGLYYRYYTVYMPCEKEDKCIMVSAVCGVQRRMKLPTDEELMALMDEMVDCVFVEK